MIDGPSVALLSLDPAATAYVEEETYLVSHRGAVYLVAYLCCARTGGDPDPEHAAGVWRPLSPAAPAPAQDHGDDDGRRTRTSMAWEVVSLLGVRQAERLVGGALPSCVVWSVPGAFSMPPNLLCCELVMDNCIVPGEPAGHHLVLGLDVGTGEWERVLCEDGLVYKNLETDMSRSAQPFELRPDL